MAREVRVARDLPARQVDGRETGFGVLNGLATGHGTEGVYIVHRLKPVPQLC